MKDYEKQWLGHAAVRYITARRAAIDAKRARATYWQIHLGLPGQPLSDHTHTFGICRMRDTHEGPVEDKSQPLCEICAGSEPFHAIYIAAAKERGAALRALQRAVEATTRTTSKPGTP